MITIFSNPRPFVGPFDVIQRNAIRSWQALCPDCEIILFEDEEKTTSLVAADMGVHCITPAVCNEYGTPLLRGEFDIIYEKAKYEIIAQINTDIILTGSFFDSIRRLSILMADRSFFMIGRRWDFAVDGPVEYSSPVWESDIVKKVHDHGRLHGLSGIDYWVFPRRFRFDPPPFVVGRPGMDSWLVYRSRSLGVPVIDATEDVMIIHQNHDYPSRKHHFFEIEKVRNLGLGGGFANMMSLRDADWLLQHDEIRRPKYPRRLYSLLSLVRPWRWLLLAKRTLQQATSSG
jgi:hypothetical protein